MDRPLGVTILGILHIIGGIGAVIGAVIAALMGAAMLGFMAPQMNMVAVGGMFLGIFGALAVIEFVIAGALFSGKSWARILVIVFAVIGLIMGLFSLATANPLALFSIVIDGFLIWYMWRPHVIEYFGGEYPKELVCSFCGYIAASKRELHNHHITCEKKNSSS
jgi:hypothetical protein